MTFVLIHGAWHGGWCWREVAARLRAAGHEVYTPTMTGLGERAHLLDERTGLYTFIADACAVIECEELSGIVLVGHSFGGLVISGVAERMKERIAHLIYLDALVVDNGQSGLGILPEGAARAQQDDRPGRPAHGNPDAGQVWRHRTAAGFMADAPAHAASAEGLYRAAGIAACAGQWPAQDLYRGHRSLVCATGGHTRAAAWATGLGLARDRCRP
jgi:pimeloyl-ACP methyl ester carboxylesterase